MAIFHPSFRPIGAHRHMVVQICTIALQFPLVDLSDNARTWVRMRLHMAADAQFRIARKGIQPGSLRMATEIEHPVFRPVVGNLEEPRVRRDK